MATVLSMEGIIKRFGSGHTEVTALKGIDFNVAAGEFISIIGPSGSGKSTFLTIAGGLQTPTEGTITIGTRPFTHLTGKERAKARFDEIGFILQSANLVPFLTVQEQFTLVDKLNKRHEEAKAEELLQSLDIFDLKDKFPKELSGGERQRVAIARALFNDPAIILADEPTASLDSDHAFEVVQLLAKEAHDKQKAIIMVTHDPRMTQWSDRTYRMKDGLLQEEA
ncbi:ABC transporter ATP-binding protein [Enterococcus sp.]|uniref:ABC transporter ATP-binding protein n=1 Tax=Enterococcus sp. TaxID=35783 RepID=UPI0028A6B085|nr:ABC transporter ATP-binding protein [Enterococcus sp.]